ncbi:CsgE family curli-type amyloid fiber assembly protein [Eoetvoesiella caeni]|uniref:Curli production assembly/transport component CsgE n=1 Tax=Eoetvoesiella caeni TaxID=645616 RepID=A0A366HEI4_9BURK|nr:CsgE family curli-type amyloid fiber assembly protein [Eoetvoesiella caeni]MCI2808563.1 curli production assembly/transport protein CsgE [Eoetvoesiella caeni]NYT55103.1 hypothetical protein [Eoetvoesiella caeni]RBP40917.1 curli production assembly/transport component CsgE [Eoetvoesiella caeni]
MATALFRRLEMQSTGALLLAGALSCAQAQNAVEALAAVAPPPVQGQPADGSTGVVLNRTITVVGFDFYQYFASAWRTREKSEQYSISIVERPTAIRGSEIWVQYRNRRIFRTFLSPTRSAVKAISQKAVGIVYKSVIDLDMQQLLYKDHDLASEELQ